MTYAYAWKLSNLKFYTLACEENWLDEWEAAAEHVRITDYDLMMGIIQSVSEYDY